MSKINISIISILLILLTGIAVFFMDDIIKKITYTPEKVLELGEVKDELYIEFNKITNDVEIQEKDFLEGFWYYKDSELRFFDVNYFLKQGFSLEDIKKMMANLKESKILKKKDIKILAENELDDDIKFHNALYESSGLLKNNYKTIRDTLEKKKDKKARDYKYLSEIYSFQGEYKKSEKFLEIACSMDKIFCKKNNVKVFGRVIDMDGKGLNDVEVSFLARNEKTITDKDGKYELLVDMIKLKKERLSFSKKGYSDTFISITNNSNNQKSIKNRDISMSKSAAVYIIDVKNKKVDSDGYFLKGNFVLESDRSVYYIPEDAFIDDNGNKYYGKVVAYLFEFNNSNVPQSLLSLDSFSKDKNFLGTSMISYGMPYIIFKTIDGKRVDIKRDNPMIIKTKLDYIKEGFSGPQIAEDKKKEILEKSKLGRYYYDLEKIEKEYVNLIPFWVLDQKTGVWSNTGFDIIDGDNGILKAEFYTTI